MVDRPIIFSAPMVCALIDGRKTQTRRVLKPQPTAEWFDGPAWFNPTIVDRDGDMQPGPEIFGIWFDDWHQHVPYAPGDRLWVRETWKPHSIYAGRKPSEIPVSKVFYVADEAYAPSNTRWVSPMFMPRWASRLTLDVTAVRVERLQEISEADARAEGVEPAMHLVEDVGSESYRLGFAALWDTLHGAGAWNINPWVVAISFDVRKGNIDG